MRRLTRLTIQVAALPVALACGSAFGQPINYGDFLGPNPGDVDFLQVTEDSPTDPTPLFGTPTRVGNALLFFPTSWAASAAGAGGADTISSTLQLQIVADTGFFLTEIKITEFGDWQLTGIGTGSTSVNVSGSMFVTDLVPGVNGTFPDAKTITPPMPVDLTGGPSSGNWTSTTTVDLTGLGVTHVQLQFNNTMSATSENQTTSFIQKKVINGPAVMIEVPTPGAGVLLAVSGLLVARRRRR